MVLSAPETVAMAAAVLTAVAIQDYSTASAFAALKADGSVSAWGHSSYGGSGAPTDSGYVKIYSTSYAFAAIKADGSITAWGNGAYGGSGAPSDSGYIKVYSTWRAFAAIKSRWLHYCLGRA